MTGMCAQCTSGNDKAWRTVSPILLAQSKIIPDGGTISPALQRNQNSSNQQGIKPGGVLRMSPEYQVIEVALSSDHKGSGNSKYITMLFSKEVNPTGYMNPTCRTSG